MKLAERLYNAAYEHTNCCPVPSHSRFELLDEQKRGEWEAAAQAAEDAFLAGDAPVSPFRTLGVAILSERAGVAGKLRRTFHFRPSEGMTEGTIERGRRLALFYQALARELDDAGIIMGDSKANDALHESWLWAAENLHRRGE